MHFGDAINEIIVSVNSGDETQVKAIADAYPCVRVISPGRLLSHAAHWEFAISHARGDWVGLLTDRGVLRRDWLEILSPLSDDSPIITFRSMAVLKRGPQRFLVQLPWFSGRSYQTKAAPWREAGRRMEFAEHAPYLLNTLIHRSAMDEIRSKSGSLCGEIVGDCGFYSRVLAADLDWLHVERPLVVMHSAETGIGASLVSGTRTPAAESLLKTLADCGGVKHVPVPEIITNMNLRANEFIAAMPDRHIDPDAYASALFVELQAQGVSSSSDLFEQLSTFHPMLKLEKAKTCIARRSRLAAKMFFEHVCGTGTSPLHRRLNLGIHRAPSLAQALDWAVAAPVFPNCFRAHTTSWK